MKTRPLSLAWLCSLGFSIALVVAGCRFASGAAGYVGPNADAAISGNDDADPFPPDEAGSLSPFPVDDAGSASTAPSDDAAPAACTTCGSIYGSDDAGIPEVGPPSPPFDAGEGGVCARPIGPGDLVIVELMIESTSGTGDHGEWIEVASTLGCALNLNGLSGNCPTGAKVSTFEVATDVWVPPFGTFLVADSSNPAINHALPGLVIPWTNEPGDVLRNEGTTVTLLNGSSLVDSVTSPALKPTPGVSVAFPSDCPQTSRTDWSAWKPSIASWFPAFRGSPNAANTDVHCPVPGDD